MGYVKGQQRFVKGERAPAATRARQSAAQKRAWTVRNRDQIAAFEQKKRLIHEALMHARRVLH